MNKIFTFSVALGFCCLIHIQAEAQIKAGAGLAYGLDIEEIGIQIGGTYGISDEMRVGLDLIYWLSDNETNQLGMGLEEKISTTALEINANFNYIFYNENALALYGIGTLGIHYFSFKDELWITGTPHAQESFSESDTEAALGLGVGAEYNIGRILIYAEPRIFLSGFDQIAFSAGVRMPLR